MTKENFGAFVDIDIPKLDREGMALLGMREALDRWIDKLMHLSTSQTHPGVAQVMVEIADEMKRDRDGVAVALTKNAMKTKAGQVHELRKDADQ